MKNNELLLLAMSEIDEEIILESAEVKKVPFFSLNKIKAIAAGLFLVFASAIIIGMSFPTIGKGDFGAAAPESSGPNEEFSGTLNDTPDGVSPPKEDGSEEKEEDEDDPKDGDPEN